MAHVYSETLDVAMHKHNADGSLDCHSDTLILDYNVQIQDHTSLAKQRCYIITIHDLGFNYKQFQKFVNSEEMEELSKRVVWIHVNLPGQQHGADDLKSYPSLDAIGEGLVCVLDKLKIKNAIVMGDGCGANVALAFANAHPTRCLGLIAIEPIVNSAGFLETMKHKLFGVESTDKNQHNLDLLSNAFTQRVGLADKIKAFEGDCLLIAGKENPHYEEATSFYEILSNSRKTDYKKLANCTFLELSDTQNVLVQRPGQIATSLEYFVQGIGLLSAMPLEGLGGRRISAQKSMEEADKSDK